MTASATRTAKPGPRRPTAQPAATPSLLRLAGGDSPAATAAAAIPRTGILLIGTRRTVAALRDQLRHLEPEPVPAGCIIVESSDSDPLIPDCPALGGMADLAGIHARLGFRLAIISLPVALADVAGLIRGTLRTLGIPARFVPTLHDQLAQAEPASSAGAAANLATAPVSSPRAYRPPPPLDLASLVGRKPYTLDRDSVSRVLTGKRVLITGAGGSIGAELARVAAGFAPELLILMERSENALFEIDRQMRERFPTVPRRAVLHDVAEAEHTLRHLVELRPHAVFHAAAHKHVPLMEDHPGHAVTNNLFGTKSIADAAVAVGAERFVMISSDKAVNPRSVMGATKRLAEVYVRSLARGGSPTRLSMVRFGNVLGSACSVLTIWSQQLAEGGPLTVTDPRMTRFFMTIPEAATLVVQSSAVGPDAEGAPVFVLDMGEPVRIVDLAVRFARAHGLEPHLRPETALERATVPALPADPGLPVIDIVFTGIRPGEKLHEELAYQAELLRPTGVTGINAWAGPAPEASAALGGLQIVADLSAVRHSSDRAQVLAAIRKHVPELGRSGPQ